MLWSLTKKIFPDIPWLSIEWEMEMEVNPSEPWELIKKVMEIAPMMEMSSPEEKLDAIKILLSI